MRFARKRAVVTTCASSDTSDLYSASSSWAGLISQHETRAGSILHWLLEGFRGHSSPREPPFATKGKADWTQKCPPAREADCRRAEGVRRSWGSTESHCGRIGSLFAPV